MRYTNRRILYFTFLYPHVYPWMEWAILPLLLSCRASLHFGWYSFPVPLRVGCWVGLGGWLQTLNKKGESCHCLIEQKSAWIKMYRYHLSFSSHFPSQTGFSSSRLVLFFQMWKWIFGFCKLYALFCNLTNSQCTEIIVLVVIDDTSSCLRRPGA